MEKSEFDILGEKFVNITCTEKERQNAEWWLYLLSDKNFISTNALVRNMISAKSKMSKEKFIWLFSTPGKRIASVMAGYAVADCFPWTHDSSQWQSNIN